MMTGKVAVITGASRGIGYGIAERLIKDGYDLAIMGRSSYDNIEDKLVKLKEDGRQVLYFSGNLADGGDRSLFCQKIMSEYGRIDLLVNNAGVAPGERKDILEMTEDSYDFVMDINLKGTFFLTQEIANIMVEEVEEGVLKIRPKIINIASISSYTSSPARGEYCISKAGISMVTKLFADRLSEYGINVYEIRPGIIYTDMTSTVKEKYDGLIRGGLTPIKRWGYPEDVARAVSVLSSNMLGFSTGEVINVDGGFHLRRL